MPGEDRASGGLSRRDQWHAVTAGYLGWTLDAFDFFVLVFLVDVLAAQFGVPKSAIIWTLTATLAMRPVGAVIFGMLADRYGRRGPLMANVVFFSIIELLCGFAPNYTIFLVLRTLYGIGMGGFWGVGASLTLESGAGRWRGLLSGLLQGGYPLGYLLAAVAARLILPAWGWRAMFWAGLVPGVITMLVAYKSPESQAWKQHQVKSVSKILGVVWDHRKSFAYLVLMLTLMIGLSHEICGEMGIGWNRRLQLFAPAYKAGNPPANIDRMGSKYGYNEDDVKAAGERIAGSLKALAAQLKSQYAQGEHYFVGNALSALDIYWTAFANLLDPLPKEQCPMPEGYRPAFAVSDPMVKAALDPVLLEHRARIFRECFRDPMEL